MKMADGNPPVGGKNGSVGAARGAGIGCGYYKSEKEAFAGLVALKVIEPDNSKQVVIDQAYSRWKELLNKI